MSLADMGANFTQVYAPNNMGGKRKTSLNPFGGAPGNFGTTTLNQERFDKFFDKFSKRLPTDRQIESGLKARADADFMNKFSYD